MNSRIVSLQNRIQSGLFILQRINQPLQVPNRTINRSLQEAIRDNFWAF